MLIAKAKNREPLRILYKKPEQKPEVKIIPDISRFKKAIVEKSLDIIPYKDHFIVCSSKEKRKQLPPHIVFDYENIAGDLIVVKIDKKEREFKSLSQEDILWFVEDLIDKSYPSNTELEVHSFIDKKNDTSLKNPKYSNDNSKVTFEHSLINVLINIEQLLANISQNKQEGENKDES